MAEQRIKGQEVELTVMIDGEPVANLKFARSLTFTFMTERSNEGYLGETTERFDTIFNGVSGNTEHHHADPTPFVVIAAIVDKARRRLPGTVFNIRATLSYPNGRRARVVFPDCSFGELPIGFSSRKDFGTFGLDFASSEGQVLPL